MRNSLNFKALGMCGLAGGLVGLAMLAGGCKSGGSADPDGVGSGPASNQVLHDAWGALGYRLDWQGFAAVPSGGRVRQFDVGSDAIVVQESGSQVSLMEKGDGSLRWTNGLATRLTRFTGADILGDRVLMSSEAEVIGLDIENGNVVTRQSFQRVVNTPPAIFGGIAVYGTASGEVVGHVLSNGVKMWGFQTNGAIDRGAVDVNGVAGVVSQGGDVVFLDPQSGVLYGRVSMYKGVASNPVAGSGAMYVAGLDQSLYAFEPNGRQRWRFRTEHALTAQPTFHNGAVYCEIPGMGLVSIDAAGGSRRWASSEARGTVVAERNGMLVVFNGRETLLVDPNDGAIVSRQATPNVQRLVAEEFVDGALYAVSSTGSVARLIPRR